MAQTYSSQNAQLSSVRLRAQDRISQRAQPENKRPVSERHPSQSVTSSGNKFRPYCSEQRRAMKARMDRRLESSGSWVAKWIGQPRQSKPQYASMSSIFDSCVPIKGNAVGHGKALLLPAYHSDNLSARPVTSKDRREFPSRGKPFAYEPIRTGHLYSAVRPPLLRISQYRENEGRSMADWRAFR